MKKILLICDRPNWAYDAIAQALMTFNHNPELELKVYYMKGSDEGLRALSKKYDVCFFLGWQLILEGKKNFFSSEQKYVKRYSFIEDERILTGIHSHHAWDRRLTTPESDVLPPQCLIHSLQRF